MIKFGIRNAEFGIIFAPDIGHETPEFLRRILYEKSSKARIYGFCADFLSIVLLVFSIMPDKR